MGVDLKLPRIKVSRISFPYPSPLNIYAPCKVALNLPNYFDLNSRDNPLKALSVKIQAATAPGKILALNPWKKARRVFY